MPAAELSEALGVDRTTLMRMVRAAGRDLLTIGRDGTRYAARRRLPGCEQPLPVFQIDEEGGYDQVASLSLADPHGSVLEWSGDCPWPLDEEMHEGWFEGFPYFLQDLQPQGFLGRAFARACARLLQLSENPREWSDEDAMQAITGFGADSIGNYIIGTAALRLYLNQLQNQGKPLPEAAFRSPMRSWPTRR